MKKEKNLEVKVPPGVDDGTRIRLSGEGEAGLRGGAAGDLYVFISIKPHRFFKRDENNIYCKVPIPMTTASLGGEIDIPSLEGTSIKIKIPSGTQSGHQFRLKGKGMSILRSQSRGDMFIEAQIETPMNLNKRQKELMEEFDKESKKQNNSPQSSGFFQKVKDFFSDKGKEKK